AFGWKVLIPVNVAWILIASTMKAMRISEGDRTVIYVLGAVIIIGAFAIWLRFDTVNQRRAEAKAARIEEEVKQLREGPATGGFPVPLLNLPHYRGVVPAAWHSTDAKEVTKGNNLLDDPRQGVRRHLTPHVQEAGDRPVHGGE